MTHARIAQLVEALGGVVRGDVADISASAVSSLDESAPDRIAIYIDGRYRSDLGSARPLVVLTDASHSRHVAQAGHPAWIHPDPMDALAGLIDRLHPAVPITAPGWNPDRGAWICATARIPEDVIIGPGCVIHDGVTLGASTCIGPHAVVEPDCSIGANCTLGASCFIGRNTIVGKRSHVGEGAVIGSSGFGLRPQDGRHVPIRHVGTVRIGDDVSIGSRSVVARATLGTTIVGSGTHIDAQVQIGHNVRIGRDCVIAAQAGIAGSSTVGDGVMIGGQAGIADHVTVGNGARIAAQSGVIGNVPAHETWEGTPAMPRWKWLRLVATLTRKGQ
jgi:UDP-3-O-[3-hydroxymyristoyl] glucosamine N-acyltransferase